MTTAEAIAAYKDSEDKLSAVRVALIVGNIEKAKELLPDALESLDKTCAIQLDTLT